MESTLKQLDQLFKLLKLCKIDEPSELVAARAAIEELMAASGAFAAAMTEISNKMQAMSAVHVPTFVLPTPDPAIQKHLARVQAVVAEAMRLKEPWEKDLDGALIQ